MQKYIKYAPADALIYKLVECRRSKGRLLFCASIVKRLAGNLCTTIEEKCNTLQ